MFPDYADTVLWLGDPIDYADTGLSFALVEALQAWEQLYYDSLDGDYAFRSRGIEEKFTIEGIRLAELVSAEIGVGHIVEYDGAALIKHPVLYQCPGTASNPAAAKCFDDLVEAKLQSDLEMKEMLKEGPYYVYSPLSGAVFDPQGVLEGRSKSRKRKNKRRKSSATRPWLPAVCLRRWTAARPGPSWRR